MSREQFLRRKEGRDCPMCPDANDANVIWNSPVGKVHLKNDADYRGYCVLISHRHVIELHELGQEERHIWIDTIALLSERISAVCQPAKMNCAMLGNIVPHLHCHLIPRYFDDPDWDNAPVFRPDSERRSLSPEAYTELLTTLRKQF